MEGLVSIIQSMLQHCFSSVQTPACDEGHCHSLSVIFNHLTSTKSEFPAGKEARSSLQIKSGVCLQNIIGFAVKNVRLPAKKSVGL